MGFLARRRERQAAALAEAILKAADPRANPPRNLASSAAAAGASTVSYDAQPSTAEGSRLGTGGWEQKPMARLAEAFGSVLSPGTPLLPAPLDPPRTDTQHSAPRRWEAPVAWNLDLTTRRTPWTVLKAMADQVDIIHRCIEIRVAEVTGLEWDFTLSDHAVSQIMADQNVGHAKAAEIGRDKFGPEIDRLKMFFEQPLPGYTFAEWMSELLWNHYVLDAVAIYPECNLAGAVTGLLVVDGSTIKPLLDNRGMRPAPPAPAYQQILWGFPRGEYQESDPGGDGPQGFFDAGSGHGRISDQLAYFVRNRRTWDPYGFSTVEECIPAATLYLGRQKWLNSEYSEGALPVAWVKTDEDFGTDVVRLAQYERIINDMTSGNSGERHRLKLLPRGFEPDPMPQIDERYKPEYDEMLIKLVGSKFGVAPTQLGVIPRTGLAGRGQMAGEQDQAETMSRQPTEEWLVDVLNQIASRFLGSSREITATFNGGQSSQDALIQAQTNDTKLKNGQVTLNDIRAANGDPLYDMPEADEPMIVTATGPVFIKGTLDAQMNPPPPPPQIHMLPPGAAPPDGGKPPASQGRKPPTGEPAESDGKPDEMAAKSAEVQAYRRFISKGARSRPFQWKHHTEAEATALELADDFAELAKSASRVDAVRDAVLVAALQKDTAAPQVHVHAPITVQPAQPPNVQVNVEAPPAPNVTVQAPPAPNVTVEAPKHPKKTTARKNGDGTVTVIRED